MLIQKVLKSRDECMAQEVHTRFCHINLYVYCSDFIYDPSVLSLHGVTLINGATHYNTNTV